VAKYALVARIFLERRDMGDDVRRLYDLVGEESSGGAAGECNPPVDVIETPTTIEILMDIPGVAADSIQMVLSRGTLVIGGRKRPPGCEQREAAFHLVERSFGRFARAVRLSGAFDAGRAHATLSAGELRVVLPRIDERRGKEIRIPIRNSERGTQNSE
jgi:HSP20 family protein